MLERLLRSSAEVNILGVVLFQDDLHLREISRRANVSPFETKRELDNLVSLGVLNSMKKGNQVFFTANTRCSFLQDLKNLHYKTDGIFYDLKRTLSSTEGVKYAFVFGSLASGSENRRSDVDVLIIGDVEIDEFDSKMFDIQKKASREINYILWTPKEFRDKASRALSFLETITHGKKFWLIGDENEFVRIVEEGSNKRNKTGQHASRPSDKKSGKKS